MGQRTWTVIGVLTLGLLATTAAQARPAHKQALADYFGPFPGDARDRPSPAEVAEARDKLSAFVKFRRAYPWRPFQTVKRPAVPVVKDAGWVRNPVDAFIAAGHDEHGLTPRPPAAKHVLLRRVYLDLTGLPPTPAEL